MGGTQKGFQYKISPQNSLRLARAVYASDYELIRDNWGRDDDTTRIFRNDTLLVKWESSIRCFTR